MKSKNKKLRFKSVLGSWKIFAAILVLFSISAVHVATSEFPLPYDEQYHMALIRFYSQQLSPFITSQPEQLSMVGDATRYGSYAAHYLLSFPLRATAYFSSDTSMQIFVLRLINISFVIGALILLRQFVVRFTHSGVQANAAVALLAALPVTSLLAAHVNYDNLALLAFSGLLIAVQQVFLQLRANGSVPIHLFLAVVTLALFGCLVKFTFLPLAVAMLLFMLLGMIRSRSLPTFNNVRGYASKLTMVLLVITSVTATGLFTERYIGNIVAYKSLQPDCSAVQPLKVCMHYGPWARNYNLEQMAAINTAFEGRSIAGYTANIWTPMMILGLGGVDSRGIVSDLPALVLLMIKVLLVTLAAGVFGAAVMYRKNSLVLALVTGSGLYLAALLQRNYSEFMSLHEAVAVQGRYVLPLIIPLVVVGFMGLSMYVKQVRYAVRIFGKFVNYVRTIHPDDAYEASARYWSLKIRS